MCACRKTSPCTPMKRALRTSVCCRSSSAGQASAVGGTSTLTLSSGEEGGGGGGGGGAVDAAGARGAGGARATRKEAAALRGFLCVHPLLAQLTVTLVLLALFLIPFGAAIATEAPGFPFWVPAAATATLLLLLWLWVLLSQAAAGCVPERLRPWAMSPVTLWLDESCIDRQSATAGLSSIGHYLAQSDGMIAFVGARYFGDLHCVYELASFCKLYQQQRQAGAEKRALSARLLLVSLDWPGVLSPLKRAELSDSERAWLAEFRCDRARCAVLAERQIVMSEVREVWGGEAAFEAFVRVKLLGVLAEPESKERYSGEFVHVVLRAVDTMFGG